MTQKQLAMVREFEANVKAVAGEAAAARVLEGAGDLTASTSGVRLAEWVQGAMKRLDARVPEEKRERTMAACGLNCARVNHRAIDVFRKRRARHDSLDDFIDAEAKSPMKGTKLWREGDAVVQAYCPSDYSHPMRCYCALVNGLPKDQAMSRTYC